MKKIPTIFMRDWNGDRSKVTQEQNPEASWVFAGEGRPTRKYDGTAVRVKDGVLWVRYDAKHGKQPPAHFEPAQEAADEMGHWPGWVPADDSPALYKWQIATFVTLTGVTQRLSSTAVPDGTYECCGPHFQGNPESYERDYMVLHGEMDMGEVPLSFDGLKEWFRGKDIEGIVWHHPDGRMAKIKKRDFGMQRIEK